MLFERLLIWDDALNLGNNAVEISANHLPYETWQYEDLFANLNLPADDLADEFVFARSLPFHPPKRNILGVQYHPAQALVFPVYLGHIGSQIVGSVAQKLNIRFILNEENQTNSYLSSHKTAISSIKLFANTWNLLNSAPS